MTHTVVIDLSATPFAARAAAGYTSAPSVRFKHLTTQSLAFAFATSGTIAAVSGWVEGRVVMKATPNGEVLLLDAALEESGSDVGKRYTAAWAAEENDGDDLRAFLAASKGEALPCWAEIQWADSAGTHAVAFEIEFEPSFNLDTDGPPPKATAEANWLWLKDRAPEANGFVHDDEARELSVSPSSIGLGDVDNTSDTDKPISDATQAALNLKLDSSERGAADGVAPLDSSGKVPAANLPGYVDDVIEAANFAALPDSGETGKIYITLDNNKTYRWSGSAYVEINGMPAFASQAEAEAGSDNTKLMTPLRTAEAIAALAPSGGGGGKVLQVVFAAKTDTATGSSGAWTSSGLSASITPSSVGSQILAIAVLSVTSNNNNTLAMARIAKGGTPLLQADAAIPRPQSHAVFVGFAQGNQIGSTTMMAQEVPGSLSPQTYTVELAGLNGSTWYLNRSTADSASPVVPRGASTLTLVEIGA